MKKQSLGAIIAAELKRQGRSQDWLGKATGLHTSTISKLVRGIGDPGYETVMKCARALGIDLNAKSGRKVAQ